MSNLALYGSALLVCLKPINLLLICRSDRYPRLLLSYRHLL